MAFIQYIDGFDQCLPPICDDDITVEITGKSCAYMLLTVTWEVHNSHNAAITAISSSIKWNVNNTSLDSSSAATGLTSPFSTDIDLTDQTGIVYLQAEVVIDGTTYKSTPIDIFDINNCNDDSDEMVLATLCVSGCDPAQDEPDYVSLWLREQIVSPVPMYFTYDELCWEVTQEAWDDRVPLNEDLVLQEEIGEKYTDCESCCDATSSSSSSQSSSSQSSSSSLEGFSSSSSSLEGFSSSSSESSISSMSSLDVEDCVAPCSLYIDFEAFTIPDRLIVYANYVIVRDTGFIPGPHTETLTGLTCPVTVCVDTDNTGTAWTLIARGCGLNIRTTGGYSAVPQCFGPNISSSSSQSSSSSSQSSSSQSSSSQSSSSSSSSESSNPYGASVLFFDIYATEEELKLTYEELIDKRVDDFYKDNPNIFDNKTDEEKEDIIIRLVGRGELFADVAIKIAIREGLDVNQ